MVANRQSIVKRSRDLAELVIAGGGYGPGAIDMAKKLLEQCNRSGQFQKQYGTHEERVLNRHLNLYRNKLQKAKTEPERDRWRQKIAEQEVKISKAKAQGLIQLGLRAETPYTKEDARLNILASDMDLDGL